jgi:hypothetical protein
MALMPANDTSLKLSKLSYSYIKGQGNVCTLILRDAHSSKIHSFPENYPTSCCSSAVSDIGVRYLKCASLWKLIVDMEFTLCN